jgi:F420-dependent oxidoreductase-like protein
MLEGWSALAFAAALTHRITLGTLVTGAHYRRPGVLVKTATTLDVLSGGRAWLGIGAGWNEEESRGLGIPFPSTAERFERLEETLMIALQMWAGDESPYQGRHYQLQRPLNSPPAVRRPHPPLLIGGGGEKKTLRLVAKYADACNLFDSPELPHKLEVLREHSRARGATKPRSRRPHYTPCPRTRRSTKRSRPLGAWPARASNMSSSRGRRPMGSMP